MFCGWWTCDSILYDLTRHDIFVDNLYMLISIWASMLMPESHHMAQLMNNNPKLVTVFPNRYGLGTVSPLAHEWATPTRQILCVTIIMFTNDSFSEVLWKIIKTNLKIYAWHKYKNKAIYIILSQLHHVHSYCLQTTNFNYIHRKISHQYSFAPRYIIEPIFIWYNVPLCQIYKLWQSDDQLVHPNFWWIWMEPIRLIAKPEICSESDWQVN